MAPGNAVPSDPEIRSCSRSEFLAVLEVFLVAIALIVGEHPGNLDVGHEPCLAGCMRIGLVSAMAMADSSGD